MNVTGTLGGHTKILCVIVAMVAALLLVIPMMSASDTSAANNVVSYDSDTEGNTRFIDEKGDFQLIYTVVSDTTVKITNYKYTGSATATAVTFPATIVYTNPETKESTTYQVIGIPDDSSYWGTAKSKFMINAPISELTINVTYGSYAIPSDFMKGNTNLTKVVFNVEGDDPDGDGKVSIGDSAFDSCTNLRTVTLPNVLTSIGLTIFAGTAIGSDENGTSVLFTFNTKIVGYKTDNGKPRDVNGCLFANCLSLKYVELGKYVDSVENLFSNRDSYGAAYDGCKYITIVYNTGTRVAQENVEASIEDSGASNVLIFYFCGGDLDKDNLASYSAGETEAKMPKGTLNGVEIPSWTTKDGTVKYISGETETLSHSWGGEGDCYTLYGSRTVTYHVNNSETVVQNVVCMYNTLLYSADSPEISGKVPSTFEKWITSSGIMYDAGQPVTLYYDLELYMYPDVKTITISYVCVYNSTTYTATQSGTSGSASTLYTQKDYKKFKNSSGSTISYGALSSGSWVSSDGTVYNKGNSATFYSDVTLTFTATSYTVTYDSNGGTGNMGSDSVSTSFVAKPNAFTKSGYHFVAWNTLSTGKGNTYYPGDTVIISKNTILYAVWESDTAELTVTFKDTSSGKEVKISNITYGSLIEMPTGNFARRGYTIAGFSYNEGSSFVNFVDGVKIHVTEDMTLYAVWTQCPLTVIVNNQLVSVKEVTKEGYEFSFSFTYIGLASGDIVTPTVTFKNAAGETVTNPTSVGVYDIDVSLKITDSTGTDVTSEYGAYKTYNGFLTIYSGSSSIIFA